MTGAIKRGRPEEEEEQESVRLKSHFTTDVFKVHAVELTFS